MRDTEEVQNLEKRVALDKQRFSEIERLEGKLLENIPSRGFGALSAELKYRGEKEAVASSIHKGEEMLAGLRSHPDWPHRDPQYLEGSD